MNNLYVTSDKIIFKSCASKLAKLAAANQVGPKKFISELKLRYTVSDGLIVSPAMGSIRRATSWPIDRLKYLLLRPVLTLSLQRSNFLHSLNSGQISNRCWKFYGTQLQRAGVPQTVVLERRADECGRTVADDKRQSPGAGFETGRPGPAGHPGPAASVSDQCNCCSPTSTNVRDDALHVKVTPHSVAENPHSLESGGGTAPEKAESLVGSAPVEEEPAKKVGLFKRFRETYKQYGVIMLVVHWSTASVWAGMFYYIAASGVDVTPLLQWLGAGEKIIHFYTMPGIGNAAVAYLFYKLATPARYTVTITGTHQAVRYLRRWGYLAPIDPADSIRSLVNEGKTQVKAKYSDEKERVKAKYSDEKEKLREKIDDIRDEIKERRANQRKF